MLSLENPKMVDIGDDAEIRVSPVTDDLYLIQIYSAVMTGTLLIDAAVDEESFGDFSRALYDALEQYQLCKSIEENEIGQ